MRLDAASGPLSPSALTLRYAPVAVPIAFAALPLYVHWPAMAAEHLGLSLATVGTLLLAARALDAVIDPWLGRRIDARAGERHTLWLVMAVGAAMLVSGFGFLFVGLPWAATHLGRAAGVVGANTVPTLTGLALVLTYLGYSVCQITHLAWGGRLGGDAALRAQVAGAREVMAVAGVLLASVLAAVASWGLVWCGLLTLTLVGLACLRHAPWASSRLTPSASGAGLALNHQTAALKSMAAPFRHPEFRRLSGLHVVNGLASAIPATLFLFFVRDVLQARSSEALFLLAYFVAAALSVPVWALLVPRWGLVRTWQCGLALATAVFACVAVMPVTTWGFFAICVGTGLALGADVVMPAALLAGVVQRSGAHGQDEGVWFGWWGLFTKLGLALAAGFALPALQWAGYDPALGQQGQASPASLQALVWAYAAVPCALKALVLLGVTLSPWHEPPPRAPASASPASTTKDSA